MHCGQVYSYILPLTLELSGKKQCHLYAPLVRLKWNPPSWALHVYISPQSGSLEFVHLTRPILCPEATGSSLLFPQRRHHHYAFCFCAFECLRYHVWQSPVGSEWAWEKFCKAKDLTTGRQSPLCLVIISSWKTLEKTEWIGLTNACGGCLWQSELDRHICMASPIAHIARGELRSSNR